jgi:hypothetical protein
MDSKTRDRSRSPTSRDHKHRRHRSRSRDRDERKHKRRSDRGEDELDDRERRKEKKARREEKDSRKREKRNERQGKGPGLQVVDDDESEDEWVEKDMNEVDIQVGPAWLSSPVQRSHTEKDLTPIFQNAVSNIPTRDSLPLKSNPSAIPPGAHLAPSVATGNFEGQGQDDTARESWMLDPKSSTIPGLIVGSDGHVAKKPELGALRSAEVNPSLRDSREVIGNEQETRGGSSTGYQGFGGMTDGIEGSTGTSTGDFFSDMGTARKKKEVNKPDPDKVRKRCCQISDI